MTSMIVVDSDEKLRIFWPEVREGLNKVIEKNPNYWMPEDVYLAIKTQKAVLICGETERGDFAGFLVLQMNHGVDGRGVFIWAHYNAIEHGGLYDAWPAFLEFCAATGAQRLTMLSSRKGWSKVAEQLGFQPVQTQYELQL